MLDFSLRPEQIEIQQRAREFALAEVLPVAGEFDNRNEPPATKGATV
jgi:hypothetical protein